MRHIRLMLAGALCLAGSPPATAQDDVTRGLQHAIGTCWMSLDNLDRVRSTARVLKWRAMSADEQTMVKPDQVGPGFGAWQADYGGTVSMVLINTGTFKDTPANVCTVALDLKPFELLPALKTALNLRPLTNDVVAMQHIEQYAAKHPSLPEVLVTVMYLDGGQGPTIVGFVGRR